MYSCMNSSTLIVPILLISGTWEGRFCDVFVAEAREHGGIRLGVDLGGETLPRRFLSVGRFFGTGKSIRWPSEPSRRSARMRGLLGRGGGGGGHPSGHFRVPRFIRGTRTRSSPGRCTMGLEGGAKRASAAMLSVKKLGSRGSWAFFSCRKNVSRAARVQAPFVPTHTSTSTGNKCSHGMVISS